MLRFCKEIVSIFNTPFTQIAYYYYKKFAWDIITAVMLICCLKVRDFILKFSISGSFFSEKEFFNLYTMRLFSSAECVVEVVDNRANYQGYKYVYFLPYHTLTVIHFMNGERVC